jgi:hypothetical protein
MGETTTGEEWFRAAMNAASGALNETGEMFIMAIAQGEDVESREYISVRLLNHINHAIATLATVNNETLSKVLEDVRETVGSDEIFRSSIEARIELFRPR